MQDRIIGPLTMIQFIYLTTGGGLCYALFQSVKAPFSIVLIAPVALLTLALVFLKINERPFLDFLLSLVEFFSAPQQRVWRHETFDNLTVDIYHPQVKNTSQVPTKVITHEQIERIAQNLDSDIK